MTVPCTSGPSKRLLLIACNPNFGRTLARILGRCGYEVDDAPSGEEALARIAGGRYDAVISEVILSGNVCGLTILHKVREEYPALPIILLTEERTARIRSAVERCSGVKCLTLPVDVDQLKQLIASTTQWLPESIA
ncbi:MAG TPA: response regulator [Candidatus Binatia bacterium]|nr:response regulator [Candidatus Binatia bacterium]